MPVRPAALLRTALAGARAVHTSSPTLAPSPFRFPAMSPTMTEGGIAAWKIKEGEAFSAGDVLLEIETDKATIDVESQDDGILGKILKPDGTKGIQVGELIGILVEDGDDTSSLSADLFSSQDGAAPGPSSSSAPEPSSSSSKAEETPAPAASSPLAEPHAHGGAFTHARPLAPSVQRLLAQSPLTPEAVKALKGSGRGGALTKGDVLKALGKTATVWGSREAGELAEAGKRGVKERFALPASAKPTAASKPPPPPQDAASLRRAVVAGLAASSSSSSSAGAPKARATSFDDVLADYPFPRTERAPAQLVSEAFGLKKAAAEKDAFDGLW